MAILAGILILVAAVVVIVTATATFNIIAQGKRLVVERYQPDDKLLPALVDAAEHHNLWATDNGFKLLGYYRLLIGTGSVSMVAWRRCDRPTVLCLYIVRVGSNLGVATDIVTGFVDEIGLTSNDSKAAQFSPWRPGRYLQSFSPVTLDGLWARHIEVENYLMDVGGARLVQKEFNLEEELVSSVRRQNAYTRSIPFWYLRVAYWYFIRRHIWHNKSVKQQHEKKMIKLPNELAQADINVLRQSA
jgi:hypothetical protein